MSYMESAMQDQIDGSIALQNQICDDACDVYKKTHLMASEILKQRAELLEALKELLDREWQDDEGDYTLEMARNKSRSAIANAEK